MKTLTLSALALAGLAFIGTSAQAVTYAPGDLLLGFRATGGTGANTNYVVNLGQGPTFRDATSTFTLSLGNIDADLTAIFGAWENRSDVLWAVIGGSSTQNGTDLPNTVYTTKQETVLGTPETGWPRASNSTQAGVTSKVTAISGQAGGGYLNGTASVNSTVAVSENQAGSNPWATYQLGFSGNTTAFGYFAPPGIEGNFGAGTAGTRLDLFRIQRTGADDGSGATTGNGFYEGTFRINDNGQVSFNVVPEPTTLAILSLSTGLLGFFRPRRQAASV